MSRAATLRCASRDHSLRLPDRSVSRFGRVALNGATHRYVTAGKGPPLLLIHGFPQTAREWSAAIKRLAPRFSIIAPDLRGLGGFPGPPTGYDKFTLAEDMLGIVEHLGIDEPLVICGHDMGAYVGFAFALRYRDRTRAFVTVDAPLCPGPHSARDFTRTLELGTSRVHTNVEVAQLLISGREYEYIDYSVASRIYDRAAITSDDIAAYARAYRAPGALRAGLEMYRSLEKDSADNRAALAERRLEIPVVIVASGVTAVPEALEAMAEEIGSDVTVEIIAESGHWIPRRSPMNWPRSSNAPERRDEGVA